MNGKRVLAIRTGALGDTLVALTAIHALASRFDVEVAGRRPAVELLLGPGLASEVHSVDGRIFTSCFSEEVDDRELVDLVSRFDVVVAWGHFPLLAGKLDRLAVQLVLSPPHPPSGRHASDHLIETLRPLGVSPPAKLPELDLGSEADLSAELSDLSLVPGRFVAIHPSSGSAEKNWPMENFAELARLAQEDGHEVLWLEGEADAEIVAALSSQVPGPVARRWPLRRLALVMTMSAVYFGNDSGVSHLAAAAGARTVAVFHSTDPAEWAPRGRWVRIESSFSDAALVWTRTKRWLVGIPT